MAYTASVTAKAPKRETIGKGIGIFRGTVDITTYDTTLAEITGITNYFRDDPTVLLGGCSDNGYAVAWDTTGKAVKAWYPTAAQTASVTEIVLAGGSDNLDVTDDDNAASSGVAVYVHADEIMEDGSYLGHLEFVSPTNADGSGTVGSGGPTYIIRDDDAAATGGVQLYFDEDGTNGSRLLAVMPNNRDCYIQISNGEYIHITDDDNAATSGVAVYFDEDAANSYERLLFVSPTDTAGTDTLTGATASITAAASTEVANGVDVGAVEFVAIGRV